MIFIANVLTMNGGSTFLVRACRELKRRGGTPTVLVLIDRWDHEILGDLNEVANVVLLRDFLRDGGWVFRMHLGLFGWIDWSRLVAALAPSGPHVHVMGSFGLLFARRLVRHMPQTVLSAGIYHQNEFLFRQLPWFVPRAAQAEFRALEARNVVFFNTSSRDNYARFFERDYSTSPVLPIGVEVAATEPQRTAPAVPPKIVSIGNLVPFKTYNRHVITVLGALSDTHPDLRYEICGRGPERAALEVHAQSLGLADRVLFKGTIPYAEFADHARDAMLFVGSGTALVEAADLGIPALIGIESSTAPETYGFLHEIEGFSYNEDNIGLPKVSMQTRIAAVLSDPDHRAEMGRKCRAKAKDFSIERTMDGFLALEGQPAATVRPLGGWGSVRALLSLLGLGLTERATGRKLFSDRRSQSY